MSYSEIISDPLMIAAIAALIGVAIREFATSIRNLCDRSKKRKSGIKILSKELENHKRQIGDLEDILCKENILTALNPIPVYNFLNSEISDLNKDEKLIGYLHEHLQNIELLKSAINIIGMRSAGFTKPQKDAQTNLEKNIKEKLPAFKESLELCLNELV